jgi:uncharacterized protein YndB with AHSA1/START domain
MTQYEFYAEATSSASPDTVFALLADAPRWKDWAGPLVREASWDREGDPAPGGVGAIRKLGSKPFYGREEIVHYDPPRRLSYTILSGQPVRNYRADVDLTPVDGGTHIRWSSRFEPAVPGTGAAMRWYLRRIIAGFTRRLARSAERESS